MTWERYLKDGLGDPWAGQVSATGLSFTSSKASRFSLEENLGPLLPIGSNSKKHVDKLTFLSAYDNCSQMVEKVLRTVIYYLILQYLYEGAGNPWAGQSNAKLDWTSFLKANKSMSDENLGFAPPIGSIENNNIILIQLLCPT